MNENIGVLPKLNDPLLPWQQKIKLAQHAWTSNDCVIPNKEQVLLGWICQQLVDFYKQRKSCSSTEIKDLWQYLGSILDSLNSCEKQKDFGFSVIRMPQLVQVFIQVFSSGFHENHIASIQLQCSQMILSNPKLNSTFLAKFDNYVSFISCLCTTFVNLLDQTRHHKDINREIFSLLEVSLNLYLPLQRKQTNHKKLFERACQHLLVPLVSVHRLLENSTRLQCSYDVSQDRINVFIVQLHQALADALFRKEHLTEYSTSLKALDSVEYSDAAEPKIKKAKIGNYTNELFLTLRKHCQQHNNNVSHEAISNFLPHLFVEFLKARRYNKLGPSSLEFDFFTEMCSLLGVHFKDEICAAATPSVLGLVYTLLDSLLCYDVYQVAEDNANNGVQFKWFNGFAELLLKSPPSPNVFQCLQVLLKLNHYIIEPHLTSVLQHCWNDYNTQADNNMSSLDVLLSSLVKTYAKLRQFDKFINELIKSLQDLHNVSASWHGLPKSFGEELLKACQSLPYGQATLLWKSFNQRIVRTYIPSLSAPSEKKGKIKTSDKQNIYKFERVVGLFRVFILNTSLGGVVEQHKTDAIVTNLADLSSTSNTEILGPIFDALPKIADHKLNVSACTSALVLYHALQEMNIFLDKFGLVTTEVANEVTTLRWHQHVSGYLKQDVKNNDDKRLRYVKVLVAVQRLRIHLRSNTPSCHKHEINELIDCVFCWLDASSFDLVSVWNQQLWTVDNSTFSVAYWFTLCNYSPILLSVCSHRYQQHFVQYLIKTLTTENHAQDEKVNSDLTLQSISRTLLNSTAFHQIPSMQKWFMNTIWHEIGQLSFPSDGDLHRELLKVITSAAATLGDDESSDGQEAVSDGSEEDTSEDESSSEDESEEHVQNHGQKIDKTPSTMIAPLATTGTILDKALQQVISGGKLDVLEPELARVISQHISLLSFLPLDWLTDQSHVGCVLGVLACDALADKRQESKKVSLKVPFLGRRLLIVLLNGCISRKRYLIHHIISMDCFHMYLLDSCLNMTNIMGNVEADQLQNVSFELLGVILRYTLKTVCPVDGFITELIKKVDSLTINLTSESRKSVLKTLKHEQCLLRVCGTVMGVLEQVIACKTSRSNELKMAINLFSQVTPPILALLQVITKHDDKKTKEKEAEDKDTNLAVILGDSPVLLDVYTGVVHVYGISQTSRKFNRFKADFQKLPWQPILASFLKYAVDSITKELPETSNSDEHILEKSLSPATPMMSSFRFLDVMMSSLDILDLDLPVGFHNLLLASILNFLNHLDTSSDSLVKLKSMAMDVVSSLCQGCSSEMIINLLNGLSSELNLQHSSPRLSTCLQVWLMLLSGKFTKLRKKELRTVLPQVLMSLQSIVQQSTMLDLNILTLEVMTKVLSLGTSMVHSHHCSLVFHGSLLVPLDHNNERFPVLFQTQFSLLSTVLFHQSEAVYKAVHVFVTCVKNMLNSLCQYCNDRTSDKSGRTNQDNQFNCAEKMSRLYQEIATHKAALSKYVPYMIAEYIQQIQQVSLQDKIKKVLVPGIYCLLDSCGEHEMALLHAVLDKGSRQLFSSLNDDYNKFYKFKGKA